MTETTPDYEKLYWELRTERGLLQQKCVSLMRGNHIANQKLHALLVQVSYLENELNEFRKGKPAQTGILHKAALAL